MSKEIFENLILNVFKYVIKNREDCKKNGVKSVETVLEYPMIVKLISAGSSIGISK